MSDLGDLSYGVVQAPDGRRRALARLTTADGVRYLDLATLDAELFARGTLEALLAAGRPIWQQVHAAAVAELAGAGGDAPAGRAVLPFEVADFVDFYASEHHATTVGRIFRPDGAPLTPNWKHLPIGYHGRAGTVVVSGTDVRRPLGQYRDADALRFGASRWLDFEAEVAFVVGTPSEPGVPVPASAFAEHVFGVALLNDWSARDLQAFETVPLGPFLGKSFATSLAAWVTPLDVLDRAWTDPPAQDPVPAAYLADPPTRGLDLSLTVSIAGQPVSTPPYATMYWTPAQLLAHLTSNGASLRTGDVFASGTVSGPGEHERGCLLELTLGGTRQVEFGAAGTRTFLEDGDEVVIAATAPGPHGRIALAEVRGRVTPAKIP